MLTLQGFCSGATEVTPSWERRNRTKSLWGNVSLLRGCLRHSLMSIFQGCPAGAEIYLALKKSWELLRFIFHIRDDCVTIITVHGVVWASNL